MVGSIASIYDESGELDLDLELRCLFPALDFLKQGTADLLGGL